MGKFLDMYDEMKKMIQGSVDNLIEEILNFVDRVSQEEYSRGFEEGYKKGKEENENSISN